ncbi:MAG: nucleotidyl transferase AbiEii/AbiGii toxin family protein [Candidatus Daviesbacteria bacterium]|nr:nucleotidyl transferase AbiEii/AbiGii toxin family protein [Candidatus Daviesbacteria bacterium]
MNKNTLNLHLEILDSARGNLLQALIPLITGFILGGGTALALQIAHRQSFDFDFFSISPIPKKLLEKLSSKLKIKNIAIDTKDELTFFTEDNIKVTFLYYPFKPYNQIIKSENGLAIFPISEIALQKAYTIGRRGEYRDYFDLYFILKNNYLNLKQIISEAKKVYGSIFDEKIFLEQLVYFGDLLNFNIVPIKESALLSNPQDIKQFFQELINSYMSG